MSSNGTGERTKPIYCYVNHPSLDEPYAVVTCITQEIFDSAVNYEPDLSDLFVVSFPKNGTTWLMNILYLIKSDGVPLNKDSNMDQIIPFLEMDGAEFTTKIPKPRTIKSHLYFNMLPFRDDLKYIFVARNPKDVVVSFYYHTVGFDEYYHFNDGSFDDFFEVFISGGCDSGDYFTMVAEWIAESKKRDNIHLMLYEDMKNNIKGEILKLADFLGSTIREKLVRNNEEILNEVISHSSFSRMHADTSLFCMESRPKDIPFVRKGIIGDWKNHMSREQSDRIDERMAKTAKTYPGFDKTWSKYEDFLRF